MSTKLLGRIGRLLIAFLLSLLFVNTSAAVDVLHERLAYILPRDASWALVAVDLQSGRKTAVTGNAAKAPLEPASLVKLITTGAILDYTDRHAKPGLKTLLLGDGAICEGTLDGNIYLVGGGNPLLTRSDLDKAARTLAEKGIRRITGDIVVDDSLFDTNGVERSRKGAGYASAGALGLDLHTVALTASPTALGKPPQVTMEPPNDAMRLAIDARTVATTTNSIKVKQLNDLAYRVSGNIVPGSPPVKWRFSLSDPALYAGGTLRACLWQVGVETRGKARKGKAPASAQLLVEIDGPDIVKLLWEMNVNSLNVVADNLLLWLGAEKYGLPGTRDKGLKAVNEFLSSIELSRGEVRISDGSGLREENRMTARFMAEYLRRIAQKKWFPEFHDSLPRPGMDGTLREIGYRGERFRVKSGRLENAFALAGYGVDGKGREIAFAYIVNIHHGAMVDLERSGAEVLKYLAEKP